MTSLDDEQRKKLGVAVSLILLTGSVYSSDMKDFKPNKTVVYKTVGKVELKMNIFTPDGHKASDKRPAIVFFFGGGWVGGTPSQFYPHCAYLASHGMVALSAEYRVKKTHKTSPRECVKDAKSAVRWVRQHAKELCVDPNKVAAGGGSAGGHVATVTEMDRFLASLGYLKGDPTL